LNKLRLTPLIRKHISAHTYCILTLNTYLKFICGMFLDRYCLNATTSTWVSKFSMFSFLPCVVFKTSIAALSTLQQACQYNFLSFNRSSLSLTLLLPPVSFLCDDLKLFQPIEFSICLEMHPITSNSQFFFSSANCSFELDVRLPLVNRECAHNKVW